jgi:hypothetical protein
VQIQIGSQTLCKVDRLVKAVRDWTTLATSELGEKCWATPLSATDASSCEPTNGSIASVPELPLPEGDQVDRRIFGDQPQGASSQLLQPRKRVPFEFHLKPKRAQLAALMESPNLILLIRLI